MSRYAIGLGSNIDDRLAHLRVGVEALTGLGHVVAVSSLYESAPVGGPEQGPFLNAVAILETPFEPFELLSKLQEIEADEGRVRAVRWGPRTLDLDIVAWDGPPVRAQGLVVPHPRASERGFVLRPLADVWPDVVVGEGFTAGAALERVDTQEVDLLARSWWPESPPRLGSVLVGVQFAWLLAIALAMAWDGSLPEGEVGITRLAGLGLTILGGGLAFVSSRRLGRSLTPRPEPLAGAELVETGPYARARHPIYGGVIMFILGTALILDSLLGVVLSLGLVPFFYFKSEYEERRLRMRYPGYRAYRLRVPRRLIPFVM